MSVSKSKNSQSASEGADCIKVRNALDTAITSMQGLGIGSPLTWLWVWDTIKDKYENPDEEWKFTSALDAIWADLWTDGPSAGFSLEYGAEDLHEAIDAWLVSRGHLRLIEEPVYFIDPAQMQKAREHWMAIGKENGWYKEPFYVQVWVDDDGNVKDSVSFDGIKSDIITKYDNWAD